LNVVAACDMARQLGPGSTVVTLPCDEVSHFRLLCEIEIMIGSGCSVFFKIVQSKLVRIQEVIGQCARTVQRLPGRVKKAASPNS